MFWRGRRRMVIDFLVQRRLKSVVLDGEEAWRFLRSASGSCRGCYRGEGFNLVAQLKLRYAE